MTEINNPRLSWKTLGCNALKQRKRKLYWQCQQNIIQGQNSKAREKCGW
uniref:Uncharacterized protein n=1 Tax=Rhizophora mucronata TaxID=61149 RepID=A0A2P2QLE6_RHIMU